MDTTHQLWGWYCLFERRMQLELQAQPMRWWPSYCKSGQRMAEEEKASTELKRESCADWAQRISFWKQRTEPICKFKSKMEGVLTIYDSVKRIGSIVGTRDRFLFWGRRIIRPGSPMSPSCPTACEMPSDIAIAL